jgi:hypothetical protein
MEPRLLAWQAQEVTHWVDPWAKKTLQNALLGESERFYI